MNDVAVLIICDRQERYRKHAIKDINESNQPRPETDESHDRLVECRDLDGVVIATPLESLYPDGYYGDSGRDLAAILVEGKSV